MSLHVIPIWGCRNSVFIYSRAPSPSWVECCFGGALPLKYFSLLYSYNQEKKKSPLYRVAGIPCKPSNYGSEYPWDTAGCWLHLLKCVWERQGRKGNERSIRKWESGGLMFWFLLNVPQRFQRWQSIGQWCLAAYPGYLCGGYRKDNKFVAQCCRRVYRNPDQSEILTSMLVNYGWSLLFT